MRYEVRFSNGAWKAFDRVQFCSAAIFGRQIDALESVARENARLGQSA